MHLENTPEERCKELDAALEQNCEDFSTQLANSEATIIERNLTIAQNNATITRQNGTIARLEATLSQMKNTITLALRQENDRQPHCRCFGQYDTLN